MLLFSLICQKHRVLSILKFVVVCSKWNVVKKKQQVLPNPTRLVKAITVGLVMALYLSYKQACCSWKFKFFSCFNNQTVIV